jgi:hypothetical protein
LTVYSLKGASAVNKITELAGLGGAYHVGVEILCLEWSFARCPHGTGVHNVFSGCSDCGDFKERIVLGRTPCSPQEVIEIIRALRESWSGDSYHLLRRNCGHFCMELVRRLQVREFPEWVNSLASTISGLTAWAEAPDFKDSQAACLDDVSAAASTDTANAEDVASELDWQEAQEYMLKRAADAICARKQRILSEACAISQSDGYGRCWV